MTAIYKKELRGYFHSIIGWIYLAVFTFFTSLYFVFFNMFSGSPDIYYVVSGMLTIAMFIIPVLTMRIFAEEKRQKSDQLLLTAPVGMFSIVMGKYLALLTMFTISCIPVCIYPLISMLYGDIPVGETYSSIFGFYLFGAAALSIGMFISTITEKQVIAIIITYVVFVGMMIVPSFLSGITQGQSNWFVTLITKLDISEAAYQFFSGTFDLCAVLFLLSVIAVFIILTYRTVGKQTFSVASRGIKKVLFSVVGTILTILLIIGANVGASYIPIQYTQFDVTSNRMYSLTDTTKNMLANLTEDVTIYCLADQKSGDGFVTKYLEQYAAESDKIHVEYISTIANPTFYQAYSDEQLEDNSMIVVSGDKHKIITYYDCYVHQSGIDYQTYQTYDNTVGIDVEGRLTATISALVADDFPQVFVVEGHNETELPTNVINALMKAGYEVVDVNLMSLTEIPEAVDLLVINAPQSDFTEEAISIIEKYIDNGGNAIFTLGIPQVPVPNYNTYLEKFGFTIAEGVVLEGDPNYMAQNIPYQLLPKVGYGEMVTNIGTRRPFCYQCQGIVLPGEESDIIFQSFLDTSDSAYCKTNLSAATLEKEDSDIAGPLSLGIYFTIPREDGESRIVVLAADTFLLENVDAASANANSDIFLNAVNVCSQTELASAVTAKSLTYDNIMINYAVTIIFAIITVIILPIVMVTSGIAIWAVRRKK